jgi:hypothetical protein
LTGHAFYPIINIVNDNEHVYHSNLSLGGACMSHVFQVPDDIYTEIAAYAAQRGQTPDALLMALVTGGVELLKRVESPASTQSSQYDPARDPLAPFIGAFDSGEDAGWIEQHDTFFTGEGDQRE